MDNKNFQVDNSDILIKEINEKTEKEIAELKKSLQEFKEKKERLLDIELKRIESKYEKEAKEEAEKEKNKILKQIISAQKKIILSKKGAIIQELLSKIEENFYNIYSENRYKDLLKKLFKIGIENLDLDKYIIIINENDKEIIKKIAEELNIKNYNIEIDNSIHGIILTDKEKHELIDNSLKGWFRKNKEKIEKFLVREIDKLIEVQNGQ